MSAILNPVSLDAPPVLRPLTPALQEIAQIEVNEVPHRVADDVLTLRRWIHKQPHLRARTNDQFLVGFLRGSKFSMERAKWKIDRYYTLKAAIPEVFNARRQVDDPMVLEIIRLGVILQIPLPADYTGPCVTIIRAGAYDTNKYKFADIIRVGSMFGDIMNLEDDNATISGYVEIMDMANVGAQHFFQLQPDLLRKFSTFADKAMAMRQRGMHFINVPVPFEKGFRAFRTFFSEKSARRVSMDSDPDAIFQFVPRAYLPEEYGGENGTIKDIIERMAAKIMRYRDFFIDEHNYGTDEQLRKNEVPNSENFFGPQGSFRLLDID